MSQLQVVHTNTHQIANKPICMLHQAAGQQNTVQKNNANGGGGCGGCRGGDGNAGTVGPPPPSDSMPSGTPRTLSQLHGWNWRPEPGSSLYRRRKKAL